MKTKTERAREHWKSMLPYITEFVNGAKLENMDSDGNWNECFWPSFSMFPNRYRVLKKSEDAEFLRKEADRYHSRWNAESERLRIIADKLEKYESNQ